MNDGLVGSLKLDQVGKCYRNYRRPHDWLRERLGGKPVADESWALRDIRFELRPGEALGIVGHNGAGKSTLLQIIAGTLTPTQGTVERHAGGQQPLPDSRPSRRVREGEAQTVGEPALQGPVEPLHQVRGEQHDTVLALDEL